jgi:hypothetical protein
MKGVRSMTLNEFYTKYRKYIGMVVAAVVLIYGATWFFRALDLKDSYSVLAGEYKNAVARDKQQAKKLLSENLVLAKDIAARDEVIAKKDKDIAAKQNNINHLTGVLSGLSGELSNAQTDAEKVPILTAMVETWSEKYKVLEGVVADKDKVISEWKGKFNAQQAITTNYRVMLDAAQYREDILLDINKKLSGKLRVARLGGKIKTGLILTAVAVVVYGEIKK